MSKQKHYISVQLPPEIADAIKLQAEKELISVAAVVRRLVADYVRALVKSRSME
jgi:hypothetical protein